ncbi:hypothetical protein, partial [Pseudomonas sp. IPO3779]|uniref:hypothetical protein n=1 Tax=Pseudomonas sp. IPO3779 TaxID=2726977 RepID=UPI001C436774
TEFALAFPLPESQPSGRSQDKGQSENQIWLMQLCFFVGAKARSKANSVKNVGAGLLANAVFQLMHSVTGTPPSRASPLPHLDRIRLGLSFA